LIKLICCGRKTHCAPPTPMEGILRRGAARRGQCVYSSSDTIKHTQTQVTDLYILVVTLKKGKLLSLKKTALVQQPLSAYSSIMGQRHEVTLGDERRALP
jgi:hypothetical protein